MVTTPLYFILIIIGVNQCPFIKQGLMQLREPGFPQRC